MFYRLARMVLLIIYHLLFNIQAQGTENLPKGGGYIIASNHRSNRDPISVGICIKPTLTFMAKKELFELPVVGKIIYRLGAFPVERGKGDTGAVDFAIKTVREGKVLAMFPEGTRSPDGRLQRPKNGCAMIAGATKASVVPVAICFNRKLYFRSKLVVRFGKPISAEELGVNPAVPSTIRAGSRLIMSRIAGLLEDGLREGGFKNAVFPSQTPAKDEKKPAARPAAAHKQPQAGETSGGSGTQPGQPLAAAESAPVPKAAMPTLGSPAEDNG